MGTDHSKNFDAFIQALDDRVDHVVHKYAVNRDFNLLVDPRNGMNGLMYAIIDGREDVANIMLNHGSLTTVVSIASHCTPLILSIQNNMHAVSAKIISMGCNPSQYNSDGNNAFMMACMCGQAGIAGMIWEKYKTDNYSCHNSGGDTLLFLACSVGLEQVALDIISGGCPVMYKNARGITARDQAVTHNLDKVIKKIDEMARAPPLYATCTTVLQSSAPSVCQETL
jgi:ankyrin repeat protein